MPEILNSTELAATITAAPVANDHAGLLTALRFRYPDTEFRLVGTRNGRSWEPGIIDQDGNRVTYSLGEWINQELAAADGDAREMWQRYKDSRLFRTEWVGSVLYLAAPYGPDPDAFFQLEVLAGEEVTTRLMFDPSPSWEPADRFDLVSGGVPLEEEQRRVLSPARYQLDQLTNIRRFLRELAEVERANRLAKLPEMEKKVIHNVHTIIGPQVGPGEREFSQEEKFTPFLELFPDWLDREPSAIRLFRDWMESSAGRSGARLCEHWFIQTGEWTDNDGLRFLSLTPQWADADGGLDLPEITPDWEASPYGVMESLSQFDQDAGYPFAWYFYMLHGNRIAHSAGSVVAKGIKDGKLRFSDHDELVLLRWYECQYGF